MLTRDPEDRAAPGRAAARAPSAPPRLRLLVEAAPDTQALLRLLEPFAVNDVTPHSVYSVHVPSDEALHVEIAFAAETGIAERLEARIGAQVGVRAARLVAADRAGRAA